jgi:hypothetical protein
MNGLPIDAATPVIARLAASGATREQALEQLYLTALSRRPTAEEVRLMTGYLARRGKAAEGYAGVLWILLSSGEFVMNH